MMKNLINLFLTTIIVFAIIGGCKKDSNTTAPTAKNKSDIERLILDFKARLNANQKDGMVYTGDSAVWYVEALLNYSFCEAGNLCHNIVTDTLETIIIDPGTNGFTLEQLGTIYNNLEDEVADNQPENTIVFAIDLYTYAAGNLTVFAARTAYATLNEPAFKAIADTAGYWFWGADRGMCGPDSGLFVGIDASDVLQNIFNSSTSDIWTSLETNFTYATAYADTAFPFAATGLYPYRMFYANDSAIPGVLDFCIWPELMNYYSSSNGIRYIIRDLQPTGKKFAWCDINAAVLIAPTVEHIGDFTYGIPLP